MSLGIGLVILRLLGFPRVSGDEPLTPGTASLDAMFSPRERG